MLVDLVEKVEGFMKFLPSTPNPDSRNILGHVIDYQISPNEFGDGGQIRQKG